MPFTFLLQVPVGDVYFTHDLIYGIVSLYCYAGVYSKFKRTTISYLQITFPEAILRLVLRVKELERHVRENPERNQERQHHQKVPRNR